MAIIKIYSAFIIGVTIIKSIATEFKKTKKIKIGIVQILLVPIFIYVILS